MAAPFKLDPAFHANCFVLGRLQLSHLLLMNNAALPWFVLVPETSEVELCDLEEPVHTRLFDEVRAVSKFLRQQFPVDKLNIASIGNVTAQMHVHVIGRRRDDYCWPDTAWGLQPPASYSDDQVGGIADLVSAAP
ncbi:MAG: HIT family protein, partial [Gammaproteobacteria bacterium]|nr:HIT family protein [Gammaproteobacteria bacterium]